MFQFITLMKFGENKLKIQKVKQVTEAEKNKLLEYKGDTQNMKKK